VVSGPTFFAPSLMQHKSRARRESIEPRFYFCLPDSPQQRGKVEAANWGSYAARDAIACWV
ncbi:MAG: hypothetical protein J0H36_06935, partial [Hyphomicrobium denitrificans]|nr:hypothetical protein [Hyphomicrobium denitrificans]